ncbi:MAG: BamA/TamA family outer membrane protein [Gemmatimonadota bacterium]
MPTTGCQGRHPRDGTRALNSARFRSTRWPRWQDAATIVALLIIAISRPLPGLAHEDALGDDPGQTGSASETAGGSGHDERESDAVEKKKGMNFIPVPIFITEPAIGNGLGAALGYFHRSKEKDVSKDDVDPAMTLASASPDRDPRQQPPTISGIAAAYTQKGSWGVGLGHFASWADDTIRSSSVVGYANINAEFWFFGLPLEVNLNGGLVSQDIRFRLGGSNFFAGAKVMYLNLDTSAKTEFTGLPIEFFNEKVQDFGVAVQVEYDSRDYTMTPNRGLYAHLQVDNHFECGIGDFDYAQYQFDLRSFHQLARDKLVFGVRLKLDAVGGDPPFWAYPWITLRGVPALRYQNERTAVVDTELRWNILDRWAAVVFAGTGGTDGDLLLYQDQSGIFAGGVGGRYLFRPENNLWVGVDLAKGPEDVIFYIQVGHAW